VATERFRVTTALRLLLNAFMAAPSTPQYGLDLADETGLKPGSLYPLLARLEARGWLTSYWEEVDPREVGRPRRRYYKLTAEGVEAAKPLLFDAPPLRGLRLSPRSQP
jgi:PadR family transcriptional regulator PadR